METRLLDILPKKVKKVGDEIVFIAQDAHGTKIEIPGKLQIVGTHYYFCGANSINDYIFNFLGLNKEVVSYRALGYYEDGDWPECRSINDFNKMLNYLRNYEEV